MQARWRTWQVAAGLMLQWHLPLCISLAFAQIAWHSFLYVLPSSAHTFLKCFLQRGQRLVAVAGSADAPAAQWLNSTLMSADNQ
jgi:hypothetical protein